MATGCSINSRPEKNGSHWTIWGPAKLASEFETSLPNTIPSQITHSHLIAPIFRLNTTLLFQEIVSFKIPKNKGPASGAKARKYVGPDPRVLDEWVCAFFRGIIVPPVKLSFMAHLWQS